MTSKNIQSIRGMNDVLPNESKLWQKVESTIKNTLNNYGYNEVRTPIVELTGLFNRAVGAVTDIVEKEMYTFNDRNDESVSLRPELTAGCVRAGIEHGYLYNQEQRLWYYGPAFRYEKPQKGRYRQFHQFGVEVFGLEGPDIDAELIILTARLWKCLGIEKHTTLLINSIGSLESRAEYKKALVTYLEQHKEVLDEDSKRRLYTNPLRILDSKNEAVQTILEDAPKLAEYLDETSKDHFNSLCQLLDNIGIQYEVSQKLIRGLDYYNRTVFEWVTSSLGAQGTICGGGRYDGLVEQLGGKATPAVGFAIGIERLLLLIETVNTEFKRDNTIDIYMASSFEVIDGKSTLTLSQKLAEEIRDALPKQRVITHYGSKNFKKQLSRADKLGAQFVIIVGANELQNNTATIKNLKTGEQLTVLQTEVVHYCLNKFKSGE